MTRSLEDSGKPEFPGSVTVIQKADIVITLKPKHWLELVQTLQAMRPGDVAYCTYSNGVIKFEYRTE